MVRAKKQDGLGRWRYQCFGSACRGNAWHSRSTVNAHEARGVSGRVLVMRLSSRRLYANSTFKPLSTEQGRPRTQKSHLLAGTNQLNQDHNDLTMDVEEDREDNDHSAEPGMLLNQKVISQQLNSR
jgi:hypothetical protein